MRNRRPKDRRTLGAAMMGGAAGLLAVGSVVASPSPAGASVGDANCVQSAYPESQDCLHRLPNHEHGLVAVWSNNTMGLSATDISNGYFIAEALDGYGDADGCGDSNYSNLEVGYTLGFFGHAGYRFFWTYVDQTGHMAQGTYNLAMNNGSSHTYEVDGDGGWSAEIDGNLLIALGSGVLPSNICEAMGGLESSSPSFTHSTTWANTFNASNLKWQDTSDTWHSGWTTSQYWLDRPCNQQGYLPPGCFNGRFVDATEWSANKPAS